MEEDVLALEPQKLAEACAEAMLVGDVTTRSLGMRVEFVAPGHAVLSMTVRPDMLNGHQVCHGGYLFTLADSAFAFACNAYNRMTYAQAAKIDYVRPAVEGDQLRAEARELNRGSRTGLYDVEVRRADGKLIACCRGNSFSTPDPVIKREGAS